MSTLITTTAQIGTIKDAGGNATAMTIDSSGKVNAPVLGTLTRNVVSFQATGPGGYESYGANDVMNYNNVTSAGFHDNTGGNYSTTDKEFQCAIAGLYHFEASCLIQSEGAVGIYIQYRTSGYGGIANFSGYNHGRLAYTHTIINMSVGERVRVASEDTSSKYLGTYGRFSGYLIG
tara:strand:- start:39 stop:566 length:528 start_codon:yes stop_codon:yes gene_type:complete